MGTGGIGIYNNPTEGSIVGFRFVRVSDTPIRDATGDFDDDAALTCDDIDLLYAEVEAEEHPFPFDMNNDAFVDDKDITGWLAAAGDAKGFASPIQNGDTNLDGVIDAMDLNTVGLNWQTDDAASWCQGDFNRDRHVNAVDLNELALN